MPQKVFERLLLIVFIVSTLAMLSIVMRAAHTSARESNQPTISEPVLTLPGVDIYEFNTPGQMHCVLAVDRASRLAQSPALSCIKITPKTKPGIIPKGQGEDQGA